MDNDCVVLTCLVPCSFGQAPARKHADMLFSRTRGEKLTQRMIVLQALDSRGRCEAR